MFIRYNVRLVSFGTSSWVKLRALAVIATVVVLSYVVTRSLAAGPLAAFEPETGTLGNDAAPQYVSGASGGSVVQFSMGTAVNPTPTPTPTTYPAVGAVGYKGNMSALTTISSAATAPAGTYYDSQYGYLQINVTNFTLDHVYIKGCLDFYGSGTLTITNSIIEPGYGTWCGVVSRSDGAVLHMSDSTVRWRAGSNPDVGNGAGTVMAMGTTTMVLSRNDISGMPDGIQVNGDNNVIEYNYIHDLAAIGTYPNNTHNDGMQIFDAQNLIVRYNRIDLNGYDGMHQNAAVFFQNLGSGVFGSPQIYGNFLDGGGYVLRIGTAATGVVVRDNVFENLTGSQYGYYDIVNGVSIHQWTNNKTVSGQVINQP